MQWCRSCDVIAEWEVCCCWFFFLSYYYSLYMRHMFVCLLALRKINSKCIQWDTSTDRCLLFILPKTKIYIDPDDRARAVRAALRDAGLKKKERKNNNHKSANLERERSHPCKHHDVFITYVKGCYRVSPPSSSSSSFSSPAAHLPELSSDPAVCCLLPRHEGLCVRLIASSPAHARWQRK